MLQYIHKGHQDKERCLLWARNTVFWPKMMYNVQELIERCIICQEHGRSQPIIGTTQELPPFPWHTLATDIFYWKRMDFLIVTDIFSKYFLVRKLANSTSGYRKSQSTEPEKAEFHTPAIPNTVRDCVQENSLENISPDPAQMTLPTSDTYPEASAAAFDSKSEDREEIKDTSAPALEMAKEQGTYTPGS